jgi:hypothetical protein
MSTPLLQGAPLPQLYTVTLDTCVVGIFALTLTDALLAAQELWPGQRIHSCLQAPEWGDE